MNIHTRIEILYALIYKIIDNCNIAYDIAIIHDMSQAIYVY